jgi:hypothetical protein
VFVSDVEPVGRALTSFADSWPRVGWKYEGEAAPGGRVFVADNASRGWGPPPWRITEFSNELGADIGAATYAADTTKRLLAVGVLVVAIALVGLVFVGKRRS